MSEPRRNPKRKATSAASRTVDVPDNILEEALKPLTAAELEEWEGWIELESEPAFFNFILKDLGVKDVKAQELFTIDQPSLEFLPKPVYGLIFLFQVLPSDEEPVEEEDAPDLWFANQTTANACATVALLNIVMNAEKVDIGDELKAFKEQTKDLDTALRGHNLSTNPFIRTIHNSFSRRMDHLNADLFLENEASASSPPSTKRRAGSRKGRTGARKKKAEAEYGYHFVAYVPKNGSVWELDGLRAKPCRIGEAGSEDWTNVARPHIEARMLRDEAALLSFNLIALCPSPLAGQAHAIAEALASSRYVHKHLQRHPELVTLLSEEDPSPDTSDTSMLSEFGLTPKDVEVAHVSQATRDALASLDAQDTKAIIEFHKELAIEARAAMGIYRGEMIAMAEEEERVRGRKKEYAPALHYWVKKLAEKGVLDDLIKES